MQNDIILASPSNDRMTSFTTWYNDNNDDIIYNNADDITDNNANDNNNDDCINNTAVEIASNYNEYSNLYSKLHTHISQKMSKCFL